MKRVNFNMPVECHDLLKGVCALKRVTVSDYVYGLIKENLVKLVKEDDQISSMFFSGNYPEGSSAYLLKQSLIDELDSTNDLSAWSLRDHW